MLITDGSYLQRIPVRNAMANVQVNLVPTEMQRLSDSLEVSGDTLKSGDKVQALLRHEQFHVDCPGSGFASLEGTVEQTLFIGKDFEVSLRTRHGYSVKAVVRDSSRTALQRLHPGSTLTLWYAHSAVHLIKELE